MSTMMLKYYIYNDMFFISLTSKVQQISHVSLTCIIMTVDE